MKMLFEESVSLSEKECGIEPNANEWKSRFNCIKQDYSSYVKKINQSGRDGEDEDLQRKSKFSQEMHNMEYEKARYNPTAIIY